MGAVLAFAGMAFCVAGAIVRKEHASGALVLGCTLCGAPFGSSGAPPSV